MNEVGVDNGQEFWEGLKMHERQDQVDTIEQMLMAPVFQIVAPPELQQEEHEVTIQDVGLTEHRVDAGNMVMKVATLQLEDKLPRNEVLEELATKVVASEDPRTWFSIALEVLKTVFQPKAKDRLPEQEVLGKFASTVGTSEDSQTRLSIASEVLKIIYQPRKNPWEE